MTTSITTPFKPDVLLTQASAARFLNGEQEAAEIMHRTTSSSTSSDQGRSTDQLYYQVSGIILTVTSYLLRLVCLSHLSKRVWVMSRHAIADATAIKTQKIFQATLLARSINTHRKETADYYLQPPLQTPFATCPKATRLNFFHREGVCRGMCFWFIFLYFKTQHHFSNPEQHVRAVGQQFSQGASRQSAFLHSLQLTPLYDLLHLNVHQENSKISVAGKSQETILREFQLRVPGVYSIITSSHQVVYIKIDDNTEYLFDPNLGCIKITSTQLFKNAMERYINNHDPSCEILVDRNSPR
ncbi:MAG: hypothetical protein WA678_06540 [Rhabdochlamydiaceae bacterium]|jgi:hypothetical protein